MHKGIKNVLICFLVILFSTIVWPDSAQASGGIGEFTGPLEKVMNTVTGPAGRMISIIAFAVTGVVFIWKREDLSGMFQGLLGVVLAITFVAFAANIVGGVFTFSGAVV